MSHKETNFPESIVFGGTYNIGSSSKSELNYLISSSIEDIFEIGDTGSSIDFKEFILETKGNTYQCPHPNNCECSLEEQSLSSCPGEEEDENIATFVA